jgi:phage-related protein
MPDKPLILLGVARRDLRARVLVAARAEAIYVLHAFEKKTQKTSARDLEIGRERYRAIATLRQHHGKEERR